MLIEAFKVTIVGIAQSFILGAIGFLIVKKDILGEQGLFALSRLVIEITLPIMIFYKIVQDFSFSQYGNWWIFPLISIIITLAGLGVGFIFEGFIKGAQDKAQFLSLVSFQNSGYLPLVLVASLLPQAQADVMFIYLFLFLLGFNLLMFSFGVHFLTSTKESAFRWITLLNPPVVATFIGLIIVALGLNIFIPKALLKPLSMIGDCTLPLATFVVGGNIAAMHFAKIDRKAITLMCLAKLIVLPLIGLWLVYQFKLPYLLGLLIVLQLSMPSATNLSVIISHYKKEDRLISQGIFFSHIISLVTIPVFLSLYFTISMIK